MLYLGKAPTSDAMSGCVGICISGPSMAKKCLVALVLVGCLVSLPVESSTCIAWVQLGCLGTRFTEPVEEVGQMSDDLASIFRRVWGPTKVARIEAS